MTIDKRRNYYLTIDTETANGLDDPTHERRDINGLGSFSIGYDCWACDL